MNSTKTKIKDESNFFYWFFLLEDAAISLGVPYKENEWNKKESTFMMLTATSVERIHACSMTQHFSVIKSVTECGWNAGI